MTKRRKMELFNDMIIYLQSLDSDKCTDLFENDIEISQSEAKELGFYEGIWCNLYEEPVFELMNMEDLTNAQSLRNIGVQFEEKIVDTREQVISYYFKAPTSFLDEYTTLDDSEEGFCEFLLETNMNEDPDGADIAGFDICPVCEEAGDPLWQSFDVEDTQELCMAFLALAKEALAKA